MSVEQIIEKASVKAQGVQVVMLTQETSAVDFENSRLKSAQSSQRTQIEVKVIVDGKVGTSTTTDPNDVEGVVSRASRSCSVWQPSPFRASSAPKP